MLIDRACVFSMGSLAAYRLSQTLPIDDHTESESINATVMECAVGSSCPVVAIQFPERSATCYGPKNVSKRLGADDARSYRALCLRTPGPYSMSHMSPRGPVVLIRQIAPI